MRFKEIERILLNDGWILKNFKGSHNHYIHPRKSGKVTIPNHPGDIPFIVIAYILKQAGLNRFAELEENMKIVYGACFYPDPDQPGAYAVVVPDLPGCSSGGQTLAEAVEMAIDAASGWVLDEIEDGKPAPDPSPIHNIQLDDPSGFISVLVLDMDAYAEKHGIKAARKNVTIPSWLNTQAEKANINFSQVLQEALIDRLGLLGKRGA